MNSNPARMFVIGLVAMFITHRDSCRYRGNNNESPLYDKLHRGVVWNCIWNSRNIDRSTLPLHIQMDNGVVLQDP